MDKTDYTNDNPIQNDHLFFTYDFDDDVFSAPVKENLSVADCLRYLIDEEDDALLVDLDLHGTRKASNIVTDSKDKPERKKSLMDDDDDDDEDADIDLDRWTYIPKVEWEETDTINWLLWAGVELGHSFSLMSPELAMPGKELLRLLREDFYNYDRQFGEKLYDLLHQERDLTRYRLSSDSTNSISDDETFLERDDDHSSEKCKNGPSPTGQRDSNTNKRPRLWKFIRHLLLDPEFCPEWIRWEDYENKTFRFVRNQSIAKLWGQLVNNPNMTYKNFTRTLRHYYKKPGGDEDAVFEPVHQRLVYKFGDMVEGLETDNPNFNQDYCGSRGRSKS